MPVVKKAKTACRFPAAYLLPALPDETKSAIFYAFSDISI